MGTRILVIAVAATAFSVAHAEADNAMSLRPQAVECVGAFCHTGVVTMTDKTFNFAVEELNGGYHYHFAQKKFDISRGDLIAVTGDLLQHDNGDIHERVRHVKRLGRTAMPPPKRTSIADLIKHDFINQLVTLEGTLVLARRDEIDPSVFQLLIKDGSSILNAAIRDDASQTDIASIPLGSRLRLTGLMLRATGGARRHADKYLLISGTGGIEAISTPPADIFDAPTLNLNSPWAPDEIVRMDSRRFDGVVMATWDGDQMMLAGRGYHRVRATLARPDELPAVGEHVTVVGFPDTDLYGINLIYARCRPSLSPDGLDPRPQPIATTLRHLLTDDNGRPRINGYSHGRLLRIRGVVLDVQPSLALFSLNDDGLTMPIDCSSSPEAIPPLETNSKIEAVVLAIAETDSWRESIALPRTRGLRLILQSSKDIKVLARPPWWTPARLTTAVVFLIVLIVFIMVANRVINRMIMRRKVSERTRLAVELHDSLSQTLAGVACQIAAGQGAISDDPETAKSLLATAECMLESSRTELKNCLFDLRSDTVDDPDFARAIRKTLAGLESEANVSIRFRVARAQMTDTTAHAILCIIRELAANAIRHGSATRIRVAGTADGRRLRFSVCDNGCGFDPKLCPGPREGHFGLAGIHERLATMNGSFTITSARGKTRAAIDITLP